MLLFLKNVNEGNIFYLLNKDQFLVGRKDCDLLIQNDQSISRKHAIIRLRDNKVTVEDCGSKYKTLYKGETLTPNTEFEITVGDNIQFGVCNSMYSLQKYEFVTTGTRIRRDIKTKLISDLSTVKGKYVDHWTSECTHLTVEEITLTVKFLHALLEEKPVVTPLYWTKLADRVKKNLPPPNIDHYNKPPVAEVLLNKVDVKPNSKRKTLYEGKLFIFPKEKDRKQLEDIIKEAGGTSISWEKNPIPLEDIEKSPKEFLIIQTTEIIQDSNLNEIIKMFAKQGKRTIPLQEIATSIIMCSCERDCNPSFNKVGQVFPLSKPVEPSQNNVLAANTQSEIFSVRDLKIEEKEIIPDTFENKLGESQSCNLTKKNEIFTEKHVNNTQSTKRLTSHEIQENPFKKTKIDNGFSSEVKQEKKDKFLCKNSTPKKRLVEDTDEKNENKSNPFHNFSLAHSSKRSKTEQNSPQENNPFKIAIKDTVGISENNPFKLSFGKKKRVNEDFSEQSPCKKRKDLTNKIFSCTKIENVSHNVSRRVKMNLTNITWISKNDTNSMTTIKDVKENQFDIEIKHFVEQFKNAVIIEVMEKLPLKEMKYWNHDDEPSNGKVNFKLFKKVKPLRPQTKIIGKISFTAVGPASTTNIEDSRRDFHDSDNEVEEISRVKKKMPKKFLI